MTKKTWVIDFDGVIANTFEIVAEFLTRQYMFSKKQAYTEIYKVSLENHRVRFPVIRNYFGGRFQKYIADLEEKGLLDFELLRFSQALELVAKLPGKKYIITSNFESVVKTILGDKADEFEEIMTFTTIRSKTEGIKKLEKAGKINTTNTVFLTDTIGDTNEFLRFTNAKNIYGCCWGYNPYSLLKTVLPPENLLLQQVDIVKLKDL
jgi:hypothetical protein